MQEVSAGVTELLAAWRQGDRSALEKLLPFIERELHQIAHRQMSRDRPGRIRSVAPEDRGGVVDWAGRGGVGEPGDDAGERVCRSGLDGDGRRRQERAGVRGHDVEVVVLDVRERAVVRVHDGRVLALLFAIHQQRHELVDQVQINVATVVTRHQHLAHR